MKRFSGPMAVGRAAGSLRSCIRAALLTLACFYVLLTGEARAAAFTWLGEGFSNQWDDATGNWESSSPDPYPAYLSLSDTAEFAVFRQLNNVISNSNVTIARLIYTGTGYSLTLNSSFVVSGGITAAYENAPDIAVNALFVLGGTSTIRNLTGTRSILNYVAPATLNIVGPSGSFNGSIQEAISLTVGDGIHAASLTLNRSNYSANIYTGTTLVQANAALVAGTADSLGASSAHVVNGTLSLTSGSSAVGSLSGTGTVNLGANALTVMNSGTFGGSLTGSGGSLVKLGAGALTLSGSSSYTGGATIEGGRFLVEGSLDGGGAVDLTGGAIGGDGEIAGSLHFGLGTGIVFDPAKTLTINGATVTFDGFSIADVIDLDSTAALGTYTLLDGSAAFDFTNVANLGAGNAYSLGNGKYAYFQSGSLDLLVVPEPGTVALVALGLGALLVRRRR